jgi:hypothetical protein
MAPFVRYFSGYELQIYEYVQKKCTTCAEYEPSRTIQKLYSDFFHSAQGVERAA